VVATTEGATWMFEQLRELRNQYDCDVSAIVSGDNGKLIDKLDSEGIPHFAFSFGFASLRGILRMPREVLRLARFFRRQRIDVVQTHIFTSMLLGRVAAWLADVPVRLSMISGPFHLEAHTSRWIDRSTQWMETMLIPSCEASVRLCRTMGVSKERLALIYYSVDETRFDPRKVEGANLRQQFGWDDDTPVIGMVAYFYPRLPRSSWVPANLSGKGGKGHEDLINAAPLVQAKFPEAKFLLLGSGWGEAGEAYEQELKALVRDKQLDDRIVFAGYHENVNDFLPELDVAVQASLSENLGGTIEGLLMECPMVVTRVGGMPDAVRDGETGVLVNPADPEDLARGIIQQLHDPEKARAMAIAGRKLMLARFTLNRTVADLAELYDQLLNTRRRKPHNLMVSLERLLVAVPVFSYLAFRLLVVDMFVPLYLPMYAIRFRGLILRALYVPVRIFYGVRYLAYLAYGLIVRKAVGVLRKSILLKSVVAQARKRRARS
jgi:glycosyltransferase involved in cell wall biosynthesis